MLFFDDTDSLRKVFEEVSAQGVGLFLVKEHGIYLVAGKAEPPAPCQTRNITYANGCNPHRDGNWRNTVRKLVGEDDFANHLSVNSIARQILEQNAQLRAIVIGKKVALLCGDTRYVRLAEYHNLTNRLFTLAVAHFNACVSRDEFISWCSMALNLLSEAAFIGCHRANADSQRKFMSACTLLHRRLNCLTPDGALFQHS
ncbi:DUF3085 domain-containing protein [Pantoea cypripedii]|uniref:DUF3085 domain-containing protein n=1 Tax=Pantoea cypripedii TaxID=55209 RepID=UPI002FCC02BC